jgi:hypothetical protein
MYRGTWRRFSYYLSYYITNLSCLSWSFYPCSHLVYMVCTLAYHDILSIYYIMFGIKAYNPRVWLLQMSHLGIFTLIFF